MSRRIKEMLRLAGAPVKKRNREDVADESIEVAPAKCGKTINNENIDSRNPANNFELNFKDLSNINHSGEDEDVVENSSGDQVIDLNPGLLSRQRRDSEMRDEVPGSSSSSSSSSDSDSSSTSDNSLPQQDAAVKKGRKKARNPQSWKQNKIKLLRNSGQPYTSLSAMAKAFPGRSIKDPCTGRCRLKYSENITEESRLQLFDAFWKLADLQKQRVFIGSCMVDVEPKYRYTNAENPRAYNKAYYFTIENVKIRVCKVFFKNTLDITDRMIQTTSTKYNENGMLQDDSRGKHENHQKTSTELIDDIKNHINSIPRIESHYLTNETTRDYIEGSKTIADLHRDFKNQQIENGKGFVSYNTYHKIFTTEFNLGFFQPKKDLCDLCTRYENSTEDQKNKLKDQYELHLKEKELARAEKAIDRQKISAKYKVVVYDLQAVMQCPDGDTSSFYYKSKLNSYNFTLTELCNKTQTSKDYTAYDKVDCYFWSEVDGKRGSCEIGSCIYNYLQDLCQSLEDEVDVIFYSDNCCGQNKNKYITTMYLYAVHSLDKIKSITHKFLIKGHTQNEADNVHSLIAKEIKKNRKSGPIYCPQQYIPLIKNAKKNKNDFVVHELTYDFFKDLQLLQKEWGYNYKVNDEGGNVIWNDIKVLKFTKEDPYTFYYKDKQDEQEEYYKLIVRNKRTKMTDTSDIYLHGLYSEKQKLGQNKIKDLRELIQKNLIPNYYVDYYNTIL